MKFHQQGDTLYFQCKKLPDSLTKKILKDGVIQHGESTGHAHRLEDYKNEEEQDALYFEDLSSGKRYLRLMKPRKIKHEEHKEIELPPGDYQIGIVRTISDFDDMVMPVVD